MKIILAAALQASLACEVFHQDTATYPVDYIDPAIFPQTIAYLERVNVLYIQGISESTSGGHFVGVEFYNSSGFHKLQTLMPKKSLLEIIEEC